MPWRQLSFSLPGEMVESITEFLEHQEALAVTLSEGGGGPQFEPPPGETPLWRLTRLTALFDMTVDTRALAARLNDLFPNLTLWEHQILADQRWERAWLKHFQPMNFGRLCVCPTGHTPPDPEAVALILDPGLAFGTGTHPTTALCLEWLANQSMAGQTVIDYGCGSGILAIAALLLGAERVIACDIDTQALTATRENARKNKVSGQLHCCYPESMPEITAEIVLANILARPLIELSDHLIALVRPQGSLVLSGILKEQATPVRKAYAGQVIFDPPTVRDQWARLSGKMRP